MSAGAFDEFVTFNSSFSQEGARQDSTLEVTAASFSLVGTGSADIMSSANPATTHSSSVLFQVTLSESANLMLNFVQQNSVMNLISQSTPGTPQLIFGDHTQLLAAGTYTFYWESTTLQSSQIASSWNVDLSITTQGVPEPGTLALLGLGLSGLGFLRHRRYGNSPSR